MSTDPTRLIRDSLYVTVGFGVIAFQKLQVRRRELEKGLDGRLAEHRRQVDRLLGRN